MQSGQGPSDAGLLSRERTGVAADDAHSSKPNIALMAAVGSTLSLRVGAASSALSLNPVDPPSWPLPLSSCDDAQTAHGTHEQARQLGSWNAWRIATRADAHAHVHEHV